MSDSIRTLPQEAVQYIQNHEQELIELIKTLTQIPAPSNHEERRAKFCCNWLAQHGCEGVYIDESSSVIYPHRCEGKEQLVAFLAHLDTVFPDEQIPLREEGSRIYAPGVGDDTANVAALMMIARFVAERGCDSPYGLLFVCNSGEEGLGNLRGSRSVVKTFGPRLYNFIALDGGADHLTVNAVGSHRYRISVRTEGGHSYANFGNRNAAHGLARLITALYEIEPPQKAKTTYNVGEISGGTSVNTIAASASMLYEFRSCDRDCLQQMEEAFQEVIERFRAEGMDLTVETLGMRPCKGEVDEQAQQELWDRCEQILRLYTSGPIEHDVNSTDANIPWAAGIPSTTIGTVETGGAHTYGEWLETASLATGFQAGLHIVLSYCEL